jgi:prepilin peptidase CpaA
MVVIPIAFGSGMLGLDDSEVLFAQTGVHMAFGILYSSLMICAAMLDARFRRIPNSMVLVTLAFGALFLAISLGPRDALVRLLEGGGVGLLFWLPFWFLRMMGAGDVKFFAASAAWLGPLLALQAALFTALFGGVLALAWLMWRRAQSVPSAIVARGISDDSSSDSDISGSRPDARTAQVTLPYGVAMAAGLAFTAWFPHFIR